MTILILLGSVIVPVGMLFGETRARVLKGWYDAVALLSSWTFGMIAAKAVYDIISTGTVFMTTVHQVFLNPFFLITGAYSGIYVIYLLLRQLWNELKPVLIK